MKTPNRERELVLILRTAQMSEKALEKELINLEELLQFSESLAVFCLTHELVKRNNITHKIADLSAIFNKRQLKPFQFLICVN